MKFLKTIRFDQSDTHVYENAAGGGEWAISGAFVYANADENALKGKHKQAFANGFLSLVSFGNSTLVSVEEIDESERDKLCEILAQYFVDEYGAPDMEAALDVATEEIDFVIDLCKEVPINSLFAVQRRFDDDGELCEEFTIVDAPGAAPNKRVWGVVEA